MSVSTPAGVEDKDCQIPFRFTGDLAKLTVALHRRHRTERSHSKGHIE